MRKRACTDLCGGRSAMVVPTATAIPQSAICNTNARTLVRKLHLSNVENHDAGTQCLYASREEHTLEGFSNGYPKYPPNRRAMLPATLATPSPPGESYFLTASRNFSNTSSLDGQQSPICCTVFGVPVHGIDSSLASESRGGMVAGTPVHSVRLPGFAISFETIFGLPDGRADRDSA
jgi:hypothetical protein